MALPKLIVSQKVKVDKQATNTLMKVDKGVNVGSFIISFLQEYSKVLDTYVDNAAAVTAGLVVGDVYLSNSGVAGASSMLAFVV